MFDIGAITNAADAIANALRDLESRLESIETYQRVQTTIAVRARLSDLAMLQASGRSTDYDDNEVRELLIVMEGLQRRETAIAETAFGRDVAGNHR